MWIKNFISPHWRVLGIITEWDHPDCGSLRSGLDAMYGEAYRAL